MADAPMVNINENSPEYMAYRLFQDIAHVENKMHARLARMSQTGSLTVFGFCRRTANAEVREEPQTYSERKGAQLRR
jgi:4-diphosphocytidyl-2C-methyl-D-erythritol kinase